MDENNRLPEEDEKKEPEEINNVPEPDSCEQPAEAPAETDDNLTEEEYITAQAYTDNVLDQMGQTQVRGGWAKELYEWTSSIAIAVVLALLINQFLFALVQVDGQSMEPTLYHNERLVVRKAFYTPKQKDIVILKSEAIQKYIVKRVIALPGQTVDFDGERNVVVDGVTLDEPYIKEKQISFGNLYAYPLTVPKKGEIANLDYIMSEANLKAGKGTMTFDMRADGSVEIKGSELVADGVFEEGKTTYKQNCYFVMGDNRNHSSDSRTLGLIPESEVVGKSSIRLFPFSKIGKID
ncbi:signal peptidase I [Congzhengia minquanensis]|uniref:Signal peptidase I n=1 Tax=Congzhengia minquanensis TaxID=2763657 RepID=A0A926DKX0_9FIRM|nr:signal peptidase I [Congzhengia minquanensis]MBC8539622.1 signal peptidase I [Congzhengia minquanensis]